VAVRDQGRDKVRVISVLLGGGGRARPAHSTTNVPARPSLQVSY
jgi:hypothetical protein